MVTVRVTAVADLELLGRRLTDCSIVSCCGGTNGFMSAAASGMKASKARRGNRKHRLARGGRLGRVFDRHLLIRNGDRSRAPADRSRTRTARRHRSCRRACSDMIDAAAAVASPRCAAGSPAIPAATSCSSAPARRSAAPLCCPTTTRGGSMVTRRIGSGAACCALRRVGPSPADARTRSRGQRFIAAAPPRAAQSSPGWRISA